jgi:hypothetical protein
MCMSYISLLEAGVPCHGWPVSNILAHHLCAWRCIAFKGITPLESRHNEFTLYIFHVVRCCLSNLLVCRPENWQRCGSFEIVGRAQTLCAAALCMGTVLQLECCSPPAFHGLQACTSLIAC